MKRLLTLLALVLPGCTGAPGPNVLLITVDTLRADHLGAYGSPFASSPAMDALSEQGVLFERAVAASPMTAPSHATIMTGRYVREHSVGFANGQTRLVGATTLAQRFHESGYQTAAFVGNVILRRSGGLARGFDVYDDELPTQERNRPLIFERIATATTARALQWLRDVDGPFFLWVHYQDPHGPYAPPERYVGRFEVPPVGRDDPLPVVSSPFGYRGIPAYQVLPNLFRPSVYRSRYADEIFFADAAIGVLLRAVGSRSSEQNPPVLLVTADHGESLGERERYFSHGSDGFPALAHVPFFLVAPGVPARRVNSVVSHVDVVPTLLALADLPPIPGLPGVDVSLPFRRGTPTPSRLVFCDLGIELVAYDRAGFTRVAHTLATWSGGAAPREATWQHYQWTGERRRKGSETTHASIRAYLRIEPSLEPASPIMQIDAERLRALGYVE